MAAGIVTSIIFARFCVRFLGFGLVVELVGFRRRITLVLVIGLILHVTCDLLPRNR